MKRIAYVFLIGVFALALGSCKKDEPVAVANRASVVLAFGDVMIEQDGVSKSAEVNMLLSEGALITTGPLSQCTVLIGGESYVQIKEESKMMIRDLTLAANGAEQTTLELRVGSSVLNPKKLLKEEEFQVTTPTAIAAVRGTQFVVATDPSKALNVSVIEGSVSLKRRVEALEQVDQNIIRNNEVLREIDTKLDEEVVITANQSATIDNVNAGQLNRQVQEVLDKVAAAPAGENKAVATDVAAVRQQLDKTIASVVIEKKDEVSENDKRSVEELNIFIEKQEERQQQQNRQNAEQAKKEAVLQIVSPVATGEIFVNGRRIGVGNAVFTSETAGTVTVSVKAGGYLDYDQKVVIRNGETFSLRAELLEEKKNDRIQWRSALGSEIKGDIVQQGRYLVVHTAAGRVFAMTPFGQPYWQAVLSSGLDSSPCVTADTVYSVTNNGTLYALDLSTGAVKWSRPLNGGLLFGAAPVSDAKNIYVATAAGKVYAFSTAGDKVWLQDVEVAVYSTPVIADGMLLFGSDDARLVALSLADGDEQWSVPVGSRVVSSAPLVYDGRAVIGTYAGMVIAFNLKKGEQVWSFKTGGSVVGNPVLAAGKVFVGSKDGSVYALNSSNGNKVWAFNTGAPVVASPVFADGRIFIPAGSVFFALIAETGTPEWNYQLAQQPQKAALVIDGNPVVGTGAEVVSLRTNLHNVVQ